MLKWSSQNNLSQSKLVRSSGIWFILVPIVAKLLEGFNDKISITIDGQLYELTLLLPFNWQVLFFAAMFFMIAGIIYQARCKDIIKSYSSYSQFQLEGNSRLQINQHLKNVVWNDKHGKVEVDYQTIVDSYLEHYSNVEVASLNSSNDYLVALDNLSISNGQDSNAFYFVYNISDNSGQNWIKASTFFYILGFLCFGVIAVYNVSFVIMTINNQ